jgi:hypothetical protein
MVNPLPNTPWLRLFEESIIVLLDHALLLNILVCMHHDLAPARPKTAPITPYLISCCGVGEMRPCDAYRAPIFFIPHIIPLFELTNPQDAVE